MTWASLSPPKPLCWKLSSWCNSIWRCIWMGRCSEWINAAIKRAWRSGFPFSLSALWGQGMKAFTGLQNYGSKSSSFQLLILLPCYSNTGQLRCCTENNSNGERRGCVRTEEKCKQRGNFKREQNTEARDATEMKVLHCVYQTEKSLLEQEDTVI